MTDKEVIKSTMQSRGWSQSRLADEAGFKAQTNVTGILNRGKNSMRVDQFVKMLSAMGYELQVVDKFNKVSPIVVDMEESN